MYRFFFSKFVGKAENRLDRVKNKAVKILTREDKNNPDGFFLGDITRLLACEVPTGADASVTEW